MIYMTYDEYKLSNPYCGESDEQPLPEEQCPKCLDIITEENKSSTGSLCDYCEALVIGI